MKNGKYTIKEQQAQAAEIAAKSYYLWGSVNRYIAYALLNKGKRSRDYIATQLEKHAGPKVKEEPVSLDNLRAAAKQIRAGSKISIL